MQTKFKDSAGKSWDLSLNIGLARQLKEDFEFDVFGLTAETFESVFTDPLTIADMIKAICQEQIDKLGIDDLEFFRRLDVAAIDAAAEALLQAIANFCPKPQRKAAGILIEKTQTAFNDLETKTIELAESLTVGGNGSINQPSISDAQLTDSQPQD